MCHSAQYVLVVACVGKAKTLSSVIVFKAYWMLVTIVNSIVATLSLAFYTAICYVFYKELEYIRRTFAHKVAEMNELGAIRGPSGEIERFRMSHQRRCKVSNCLTKSAVGGVVTTQHS